MHRYLPALFARDGWKVAHIDVAHQPRVAGSSNYSNLQRGLVGLVDLFGVFWLIRRKKKSRAVEVGTANLTPSESKRVMSTVFAFLNVQSWFEFWWVAFGLGGQLMFSGRFIVQWIASEKAGRSVIPLAFWYFSIAGGVILFLYALYRRDPVFILGQSLGLFIYSRNLWLIYRERSSDTAA